MNEDLAWMIGLAPGGPPLLEELLDRLFAQEESLQSMVQELDEGWSLYDALCKVRQMDADGLIPAVVAMSVDSLATGMASAARGGSHVQLPPELLARMPVSLRTELENTERMIGEIGVDAFQKQQFTKTSDIHAVACQYFAGYMAAFVAYEARDEAA